MKLKFAWTMLLSIALAGLMPAATVVVQSGGIAGLSFIEGTGTSADPWLIDETMTSAGTLLVRNPGTQNTSGTFHEWGRWVSKTVLNSTAVPWTSFELELQVTLGVPSPPGDGLSFADGDPLALAFTSDQFGDYTRIDTTRDYLNFHNGNVMPGESVTFNFIMTDNSANNPFYLLQTPNRAEVPEPATFALMGAGLLAVAAIRRKVRN